MTAHSEPVLIAGSGPVGRALAAALESAGVVVDRWTRDRAAPAGPRPPLLAAVIAVRDAAVGPVAARLFDEGWLTRGAVVVHTAGALTPSQALAPVAGRASGLGLLHPLRAFAPGAAAPPVDLAGTVFGIAGDPAGSALAASLCARVGGVALRLDEAALPRYHAAAALAANHTLALVDAAIALLEREGLERAVAERAIAALLKSAADNVAAVGLPAALTGPIARGDDDTVRRHLAALPPAVRALYRATGHATVDLARRLGRAEPEALARIEAELAAGPEGAGPSPKR